MDRAIYLEIPGIENHALATDPRFTIMPIRDFRPYMTPAQMAALARADVATFQRLGIPPERAAVRFDLGMSYACPGAMADSAAHPDRPVMVGPGFEETVRALAAGHFDYRKRVSIPDAGTAPGWVGCEQDNLSAYIANLGAYKDLTAYHDLMGEWILSEDMRLPRNHRDFNTTIDRLLDLLKLRPFDTRSLTTSTIRLAMKEAGHAGKIVVPHLSRLAIPRDQYNRPWPASKLPARFVSHHWFTSQGEEITRACAYACGLHAGAKEPYWIHLNAQDLSTEEMASRIALAPTTSQGAVAIFADSLEYADKIAGIRSNA